MSRENILDTLIAAKSLTQNNIVSLKSKTNDQDFLQELVLVYEKKVTNYLGLSSRPIMKKIVEQTLYPLPQIEAMCVQHIIDYTYSSYLQDNKAGLLFLLAFLLKKISPDLAVSLGFSTVSKIDNTETEYFSLKDQISKVFISYIARYQLALEINPDDLQALCQSAAPTAPDIFPLYLLQSLLQQKIINITIEAQVVETLKNRGGDKDNLWAKALSDIVKSHTNILYLCIRDSIFYVSQVIRKTPLKTEDNNRFFAHLRDDNAILQFSDVISRSYLQAIASEKTLIDAWKENADINCAALTITCLSTLPIIGIKVTFNTNQIAIRQAKLQKSLETLQNHINKTNQDAQAVIATNENNIVTGMQIKSAEIDKSAAEALDKQNSAISKWRSNFKPQFEVTTMPNANIPGKQINF